MSSIKLMSLNLHTVSNYKLQQKKPASLFSPIQKDSSFSVILPLEGSLYLSYTHWSKELILKEKPNDRIKLWCRAPVISWGRTALIVWSLWDKHSLHVVLTCTERRSFLMICRRKSVTSDVRIFTFYYDNTVYITAPH